MVYSMESMQQLDKSTKSVDFPYGICSHLTNSSQLISQNTMSISFLHAHSFFIHQCNTIHMHNYTDEQVCSSPLSVKLELLMNAAPGWVDSVVLRLLTVA